MTRAVLAWAAAAAAVTLGWTAMAADDAVTVTIHNYAYGPAVITVPKGGKVTWVNRDDTPHTVVAADKRFRSPALDTDDSFSKVYDDVGSFPYVCGLHPQMRGVVVVGP